MPASPCRTSDAVEHIAILRGEDQFESLHRKDDLFEDGVATVFGIAGGEAELQAFTFRGALFTPAQAREWLRERGFVLLDFAVSSP